jgi:hypothetical protein
MLHAYCVHSSHYGRVCPSFLSWHAYDRANKRVCRRTAPINYQFVGRPSIHPSFLASFLPSQAYDKQLSCHRARSTAH